MKKFIANELITVPKMLIWAIIVAIIWLFKIYYTTDFDFLYRSDYPSVRDRIESNQQHNTNNDKSSSYLSQNPTSFSPTKEDIEYLAERRKDLRWNAVKNKSVNVLFLSIVLIYTFRYSTMIWKWAKKNA